jgi:hypothetical protein
MAYLEPTWRPHHRLIGSGAGIALTLPASFEPASVQLVSSRLKTTDI